mmetsp:Transcript_24722/g.57081  ORF Transcript_24722/g.57081 Transcript_24722/m.57081 type:complete len:120 (+) Transcript_24722:99-458(+)
MEQSRGPILLLLTVVLILLQLAASVSSNSTQADRCAEDNCTAADGAEEVAHVPEGDPEDAPPPPYFSGPVWQDLRLLIAFGAGVSFMHAMEAAQGDRDVHQQASVGVLERKFQMYPYAL